MSILLKPLIAYLLIGFPGVAIAQQWHVWGYTNDPYQGYCKWVQGFKDPKKDSLANDLESEVTRRQMEKGYIEAFNIYMIWIPDTDTVTKPSVTSDNRDGNWTPSLYIGEMYPERRPGLRIVCHMDKKELIDLLDYGYKHNVELAMQRRVKFENLH